MKFKTQPGKWKYVLTETYEYKSKLFDYELYEFYSLGKPIGCVGCGKVIIYKGYAWDGCSPSMAIRGIRIGTPSPPQTREASLVHDFLCQFINTKCTLWNQNDSNDVFHDILKKNNFILTDVYFFAVDSFGWIYKKFSKNDDTLTCKKI